MTTADSANMTAEEIRAAGGVAFELGGAIEEDEPKCRHQFKLGPNMSCVHCHEAIENCEHEDIDEQMFVGEEQPSTPVSRAEAISIASDILNKAEAERAELDKVDLPQNISCPFNHQPQAIDDVRDAMIREIKAEGSATHTDIQLVVNMLTELRYLKQEKKDATTGQTG